jgi:hypothetical protein
VPTHASEDAVKSEDLTSGGPLTRRRFLTYVVAAPVLTVAASSVGDLMALVRRMPWCRALRSRRTSPIWAR